MQRIIIGTLLSVCAVLTGHLQADEPVQMTENISLDGAKQALNAAVNEAKSRHTTGAFAIVDAGGSLVAMERIDGTFAAAAHVAVDKARTSAMFQKPTRVFENVIREGRTSMVALTDFTPLQGGVPLMHNGKVVGAIGVSGASNAQEDDDLAVFAANAFENKATQSMVSSEPGRTDVVHLESQEVRSAFAKGMPLIENSLFKVHASRRTDPGQAEVHADETDIFYILEGTATFVTGGTVVNGKEIEPKETRGSSIEGGETVTLQAGDIIIIPAGTPHWFKQINSGPFLYYTVKAIEQ